MYHIWCAVPLYYIPKHAYVDQIVVEDWREADQSWYWQGVDRTAMGSISRGFASLPPLSKLMEDAKINSLSTAFQFENSVTSYGLSNHGKS